MTATATTTATTTPRKRAPKAETSKPQKLLAARLNL